MQTEIHTPAVDALQARLALHGVEIEHDPVGRPRWYLLVNGRESAATWTTRERAVVAAALSMNLLDVQTVRAYAEAMGEADHWMHLIEFSDQEIQQVLKANPSWSKARAELESVCQQFAGWHN